MICAQLLLARRWRARSRRSCSPWGVEATSASRSDDQGEFDPRAAPPAPKARDLPASIFTEGTEEVAVSPGSTERKTVLARSLDADEDGSPEEVRYFDPRGPGESKVGETTTEYTDRGQVWRVTHLSEAILYHSSGRCCNCLVPFKA